MKIDREFDTGDHVATTEIFFLLIASEKEWICVAMKLGAHARLVLKITFPAFVCASALITCAKLCHYVTTIAKNTGSCAI